MEQPANSIHIWQADWFADQRVICDIRYRVFVEEQGVPESLEWDGLDNAAIHVLARPTGKPPCATARLLATGQIGRLAVLPDWRGHGLGSALLTALIDAAANRGMQRVFLHAQLPALEFYRRHGFRPEGGEFQEAGILHRRMGRDLP